MRVEPDWGTELGRLAQQYRRRADQQLEGGWSWMYPEAHWLDFALQRFMRTALARAGWTAATITHCRLLEIGAGEGQVLRWAYDLGLRHVVGIEVLPERAQLAAQMTPWATVVQANMGQLPFMAEAFDSVLQFVTFSSCLDQGLRQYAAGEMLRVLKPHGVVIWCDMVEPQREAEHLREVTPQELTALFPGCRVVMGRVGVKPRWLGPLTSLCNHPWVTLLRRGLGLAGQQGTSRPVVRFPLIAAAVLESIPWATTYLAAVIYKD